MDPNALTEAEMLRLLQRCKPEGYEDRLMAALKEHLDNSQAIINLDKLGPAWMLSQADFGGWEDQYRWWCWLEVDHGGDGLKYTGHTPLEATTKALKREGGEEL